MPQVQSSSTTIDSCAVHNVDRVLPHQYEMSKLFTDDRAQLIPRLSALMLSILPQTQLEDKWQISLKPGFTYATHGSELSTLHFYQLLTRLTKAKHVLELGTYIGVSALFFAEAVGADGHVTTVEWGDEVRDIALANFKNNGYSDRITSLKGDVLAVIREMAEQHQRFDVIFMDAAKQHYGAMLEPSLNCLQPGGLLIVDDVFMQGDVLNTNIATDKGQGVRDLLDKVAKLDQRYNKVILPIGDGTLLITAA